MPSGDQFGALVFPAPEPETGFPAGDPGLGYLVAFLKAAVNADCGALWESICPGRGTASSPVLYTFTHDPRKLFDELRLPALYVWRGKSTRARVGDDLYRRTTKVRVAWIHEPAQDEHLILRDPAMNAISDAIDIAISNDRHPSWVVTDDADPVAADRGSSLSAWCEFSRCQPTGDEPQELMFQRIEEAAPLPYYGFAMDIEIDEYPSRNPAGIQAAKLNATTTTNDGWVTKPVEDVPDAPGD